MLLSCDASQLEWRTLLQLANDKVGIQEVVDKADAHSLNQAAFNLPSRLIAKIYLFRTIFRGSGWSFANDPDFMHVSSKSQFWDDLNIKFFSKYYGVAACHNKWKDIVMAGKAIEGPLGRSWSINIGYDSHGALKIPWTTLTNYPVQGTGADIMMLARISAYKRIKAASIPCKFISTVHDSIVLDCEEQYVPALVEIFHGVFRDIPKNIKTIFGYDWIVPMECECKMGINMKDMAGC
jgi:DNA polymerase I-like protein with 3'-5' exonuclease and polymerase domains